MRILPFFILILLSLSNSLTAYFQQRVKYDIQVKLLPGLNRLEGYQILDYKNNSPDTLRYLYFHLYINRFAKIEHSSRSQAQNTGYQRIIFIKDSVQRNLDYEINRTVLKLKLSKELAPGESQKFFIRFNTVLPSAGERFGYYGTHFDVGAWYPVPAVYDKFGWHADQHLKGEFYQEWGDYYVEITVPKGYVVAGSGKLLNPEVYPENIKKAERKMDYTEESDSTHVTYKFLAENVHDFAWSADPEFVLREIWANDVKIKFFILDYRLDDWVSQMEFARKAVLLMEELVGPYPYEELNVVDGYITAGGIEYPNLVIINDLIDDPYELCATIVHEIVHQWFYGLIANNQTHYGWMDEGFATFFEKVIMEKIYPQKRQFIESPTGLWGKLFGYYKNHLEYDRLRYLQYVRSGKEEIINRHFDWFQYDPYLPYYQKMSLVISQLRLVLGDSLFWASMKKYYRDWRFRHPYPEDLIHSFEQVSNRELEWFFDEWLTTTWHCDYSVEKLGGSWKKSGQEFYYFAKLKFKRNEPIVMPLDFRVFFSDGSYSDYRIPVASGSDFEMAEEDKISPWLFTEKEKVVNLKLPLEIKNVLLNPHGQLLDINPFNNDTRRWPKFSCYWLKRQYILPHLDSYTMTIFPYLFFNQVDGIQIGIRTRGNYIFPDYQHRFRFMLSSRSLVPELDFWFEHPLYDLNRDLHFISHFYNIAGRRGFDFWLQWKRRKENRSFQSLMGWDLRHLADLDYLPFSASPGTISVFKFNVSTADWKNEYLPSGWEIGFQGETEEIFRGIIRRSYLWRCSPTKSI